MMQNMFKKANALNNNAAHFQRKAEMGNADASRRRDRRPRGGINARLEGRGARGAHRASSRSARAAGARHRRWTRSCVLYEFVELLVRIAFWRANPYHGIHKLATKLIPLPDCLHHMLHEVILPNASRDDTEAFRERVRGDPHLQAALRACEPRCARGSTCTRSRCSCASTSASCSSSSGSSSLKKGWGTCAARHARRAGGLLAGLQRRQLGDLPGLGDHGRRALPQQDHCCALSLPAWQARLHQLAVARPDDRRPGQGSTDDITRSTTASSRSASRACALDKYKTVKGRGDARAAMITAFVATCSARRRPRSR